MYSNLLSYPNYLRLYYTSVIIFFRLNPKQKETDKFIQNLQNELDKTRELNSKYEVRNDAVQKKLRERSWVIHQLRNREGGGGRPLDIFILNWTQSTPIFLVAVLAWDFLGAVDI